MFKNVHLIVIFSIALIIVSCGGGAESSNAHSTPITPLTIVLDSNSGGISDGESNVSLIPSIVLSFNQEMLPASINHQTITLQTTPKNNSLNTKNTFIALGEFTASNNNTLFTVSPLNHLSTDTTYVITVSKLVASQNGEHPQAGASFSFTTGSVAAPTVVILNPSNHESNVNLTPLIQFQFSESVANVNPTTVKLITTIESTQVQIESIVAGANNTYTLNLNESLSQLTQYNLILESSIHAAFDIPLAQTQFNFTTGKFSQPTAMLINPNNGATNVNVNTIIQVQFSESVNNVTTATLQLHIESSDGTTIPTQNINNIGNDVYQLTPIEALELGKNYYITASAQISDDYGHSLNSTTFHFTSVFATWQTVGQTIPVGRPWGVNDDSLAFNPLTGQPYVAFVDYNNQAKITVMKYDNQQWVVVGNSGFSAESANFVALKFNPQNNQPNIFYQTSNEYQARVMTFDGVNWSLLGDQSTFDHIGISAGGAPFDISKSGIPYVALEESTMGFKITTMGYINSTWQVIGSRGFTVENPTTGVALTVNPQTGLPYLAYQPFDTSNSVIVMAYDGSAWNNVGASGQIMPNSNFGHISLSFNPLTNDPYIATLGGAQYSSTLMISYFNGTNWLPLGDPASLPTSVMLYSNLVFSSTGKPYIAYSAYENSNTLVIKYKDGVWSTLDASIDWRGDMSLAINPNTNLPTLFISDSGTTSRVTNYLTAY